MIPRRLRLFSGGTRRFLFGTLLLYTLLTAAMTYPQVLHMRDAVHDDGDPLLNAWALAWVAHALPTDPAHLFNGNIFYPERRTLAYSETLLAPAIAAAPLRWLGLGPIVVYNIVFLSGFIVSGAGTALLVRRLTRNAGAGVIAGIVFAFLPYRIDHYAHLQLQQTQFLPLALWAFDRLLDGGRTRDGILVGAFAAGQVLSCMYYGLFLAPYFAGVAGVLLVAKWRDGSGARRLLVPLAAGAAIAAVLVLPVVRAYLGARQAVGERTSEEVVVGSASLRNYLGPPPANAVYGSALAAFAEPERRLFPGFLAAALAIVGAVTARPRRYGLAYLAGLLIAVDISLGFNGITYRLLYEYVLPFRGLRVPARMGIFAGFSIAVLAGFASARIADRLRPSGGALALGAIGALMLVEYASTGINMMIVPTSPLPVYAEMMRDRADSPRAAVVEFPASPADDPTYMYYSTFHWQLLVNGYSGFFPRWYREFPAKLVALPAPDSIRLLKSHDARYLIIHGERLYGGRYDQLTGELNRRPEFRLVSRQPAAREGQHGETSLYKVLY